MLHLHTDALIRVQGLYPWRGFLHESHGAHSALASDLMEPFRHLVERTALSLVARKQLTLDHFEEKDGLVRISDPARRQYLGALVEQFSAATTSVADQQRRTHLEHLARQCENLKRYVDGTNGRFDAWRTIG